MRISDWSSDVCSSDLPTTDPHRRLRRSAAAAAAQRRDPVGPEIRRDQEPLPGYLPAGGETVNAALIFAAERLGRLRPALGVVLLVFVWWLATVMELADPRSEEHTSELQSLMRLSYAVFCLKKKHR